MPDEENTQPTTADAESSGESKPEPAPEASPTSDVGSDSAPASPDKQEPISENIPETKPVAEIPQPAENEIKIPEPNITVTKTPQPSQDATAGKADTVTITEVMQPEVSKQKNLWQKFLEKVSFNKKKKLEKIMKGIETAGKITNDDVEKNLRVSHATATRYLDILEKEGKIRQVGKTGKYTYYEKI